MKIVIAIVILFVLSEVSCVFEFMIAHTNDMHARVEEFNKYGGYCSKNSSRECYGGVARRYTVLRDHIRKKHEHVLLLDAGDVFQGTVWYAVYKGLASVQFMNDMKYDAMAVGNHDFDDGPSALKSFVKQATFNVLSSNMLFSGKDEWTGHPRINKSVILERSGRRIGVIGYTTSDTKWLSKPGPNIQFYDVIESVRQEAQRLVKIGVNILIALGHAGIETDKKIASEVNEIDVVVGGHSNTFLFNGEQPLNDKIEGPYPIVFTRKDGTKAIVVQDYAYGKYLGNLSVSFDDYGKLLYWSGNPILLSNVYQQDMNVLKKLESMQQPILKARNEEVGRSLVRLDGDSKSCRHVECNMGNLVADAVVRMSQQAPDESKWATVGLSVWNGGGIRNSIDKNISESITAEDIFSVLPFGTTADIVEMYGKELYTMFEHSVSSLPQLHGRFLQVSGFHVKYNIGNEVGKRVVELKALCVACRIPEYKVVEINTIYKVIVSNYMLNGGDKYNIMFIKRHSGDDAATSLNQYVKQETPLATPVEGRIQFVTEPANTGNSLKFFHKQLTFLFLPLIVSCLT